MKSNQVQNDRQFLEKLICVPRGLNKKIVTMRELGKFLNVISLEDLVFTLHQFATYGYFRYEVILSDEYLDWEQARAHALLDTSPLKPMDPFGGLRRKKYNLMVMGREIKTNVPLSASEISEAIRVLPTDLAEQFLRFKLSKIDLKRLREIVAERLSATAGKAKIDNRYSVEHKGLVVSVADVSYKGVPIDLERQQRELLRLLVTSPGVTIHYDTFYDTPEIYNHNKSHKNPRATVSKLVSATRKKVHAVVGQCIVTNGQEGWLLRIE